MSKLRQFTPHKREDEFRKSYAKDMRKADTTQEQLLNKKMITVRKIQKNDPAFRRPSKKGRVAGAFRRATISGLKIGRRELGVAISGKAPRRQRKKRRNQTAEEKKRSAGRLLGYTPKEKKDYKR